MNILGNTHTLDAILNEFDLMVKDWHKSRDNYVPWKNFKLNYPIDLYFTNDASLMHIEIAVPGVSKEEISVSTSGDSLTVKLEKTKKEIQDDINYMYRNISKKDFDLTWKIDKYDLEKIEVVLKDGLLKISIPLKKEEGSKKIIIG